MNKEEKFKDQNYSIPEIQHQMLIHYYNSITNLLFQT